jgi:hypothetical protein
VVLTYGQTRFRAPAEPAFVLLSAVALDALLRRGRRDDDAGAMHAAGPPRAPSAPALHA